MQELRQKFGFKLKEILPLTTICKSTYEYHVHPKRPKYSDGALVSIIKMIKHYHPAFGYWTVTDDLRVKWHLKIDHKRVYRLMQANHLSAKVYNLRAGKYDSSKGPQGKKAQNRLHRRFMTDRPLQKVVTDISEFRYGTMSMKERVYLSPFKDLYGGVILGYTITDRPLTSYVLAGLQQVINKRPNNLGYRMTIHSDQGIQYQSHAYRAALKKQHIFQSMSRRGNCYDNAAMESFFHTMKVEMYFTHHYATKAALIQAMETWIGYYNQKRDRHKLKGATPNAY
ncbi:IS3 family transposase, partial [Lactobacillus acetotolerans]